MWIGLEDDGFSMEVNPQEDPGEHPDTPMTVTVRSALGGLFDIPPALLSNVRMLIGTGQKDRVMRFSGPAVYVRQAIKHIVYAPTTGKNLQFIEWLQHYNVSQGCPRQCFLMQVNPGCGGRNTEERCLQGCAEGIINGGAMC